MTTDGTHKPTTATVLQASQLAVLLFGVGVMFMVVGKRDAVLDASIAQITELKEIVSDLVRVTGSQSVSVATLSVQIQGIEKRIDKLENTTR